jgi:peptidoglycan/LPS O-acetylase OafA/YrhL
MTVTTARHTASGDEAGTAPGDRPFRPDVQGLRAIAILFVVLYHADIPGITGGFVGVDVFFVISGFVITGVLLRERAVKRRTSVLHFYARRARRIIPAATVVIIVTVIAAYLALGSLPGHDTATDGQWAALFLANFHFAATSTNYLASQRPPSALQNYWSLAVEEQFYIVYPTIFFVTTRFFTRLSLRARLTGVLLAVIIASFVYSVVLTSTNAPGAFFSPFTRAWELALGGLIAIWSDSLRRLPQAAAAFVTWLGLAAIVTASLTLTSASVYPGALVAIPVLGAAMIIAGGTAQPGWGVEGLLRRRPFQFLGLISFSLYLWHWPILVIVTQRRGALTLPVWDNVVLLLIATGAAIITYRLVENPIRHSGFLITRAWVSIALGLCLIGATVVVTTIERNRPTVNLGSLAEATQGSVCHSPTPKVVAGLKSAYRSGHPRTPEASNLEKQSVVMIGDSTACTLLQGVDAVGPTYRMQFVNGAVIGCGIVSGEVPPVRQGDQVIFSNTFTKLCQGQANRAEATAIERSKPRIIVWASTQERNPIVAHTRTGSEDLAAGTPKWHAVMLQRIDDRLQQLTATGARVILLLEPPSVHSGNQSQPNAADLSYGPMNSLLREAAAQHSTRVAVVNLAARVCPSGPPCPYIVDGHGARHFIKAIRPDDFHYSPAGALWVAKWLVPQIAAAAKKLS